MFETDYIIEKDSSIGDGFHSIPNPVKGLSLIAQRYTKKTRKQVRTKARPKSDESQYRLDLVNTKCKED